MASWLHHGPDWIIKAVDGSEIRVVEGDWLVDVRAKNDAAWRLVKEQIIGGASPEGRAIRRTPDPAVVAV